ncbi:type VI secretion system baseplate subunit TssF [Aquabacter sp. L1I39]|uniref:type VI secretion system baseplate subunit TssF n=1 Tax=Aquabacter sp. L1I39 TaxID=2820278 RepID=UPI001ADB3DE0|nr:type VI secretion system baseplate subunit TssF [Aquabacter sp. L1I39]QTL01699.1 type VI secretion system baseplate subunit TssF [Aquabacter sp. L1I39]
MTDALLPYYNDELDYLRHMAGEFAARHPKIASHLRLSADAVDDPHVARLMEGVAFLNARVARKLDDDFPELVNTLLDVLYPYYLAPIPSMSTVQFQPKAEVTVPQQVPVGTELETEPVKGEACRFRTCYPVTVWPIDLAEASLRGRPLVGPINPHAHGAAATLHLKLRCTAPDQTFGALQPDHLRFFLRGQPSLTYGLQELILNHTVSVALAEGPADPEPVFLPPSAIHPVGFAADEGLLPHADRAQPAYRLLTEYFAFPEKFLYFDVDLAAKVLRSAGRELSVFLYFDKSVVALERSVNQEAFALGCTPVINLFRQRAEPILVSSERFEHRVIPDARRPDALEVHSILSVSVSDAAGALKEVLPFYAQTPGAERAGAARWAASRREAPGREVATEMFLSFSDVDPDFSEDDLVASVNTLCLNGNLPARLPYGGGHPVLTLVEGAGSVGEVACVSALTHALRLPADDRRHWRLMSHLILNHLSLVGPGGLEALQEILRLYDFRASPETHRLIQGITGLSARPGVARAPRREGDAPWAEAVCRGIDIAVELDPSHFSSSGLYLFAMVLDRFFALQASINSFTRLTATVKGQTGPLKTWPARAGDRTVL